jgi:group I intron endonuclease
MKVFSVYKATNKINGKSYVGCTGDYTLRLYHHKRSALQLNEQNSMFYRALRKYGWDAFEWEIICQSLDGEYTMNFLEPYFIEQYDTYKNGYNMNKGGNGTLLYPTGRKTIITEETKKKISETLMGHTHSEETRKKIGLSGIGRKHTDEAKKKISAGWKDKKRPPETIERMRQAKRNWWANKKFNQL